MQIKDIYGVFKEVADAYDAINEIKYSKVWDVNGQPTQQYPLIVFESSPEYISKKSNSGTDTQYLPISKEYKIKLFLFDKYSLLEQGSKTLEEKQSDLQIIFERYLAEVQARLIENNTNAHIKGRTGNGFFGNFKAHNDKLVEIFEEVVVSAKTQCTRGTFNY